MGRVEIVYSPDESSSGRIKRDAKEVVDTRTGKVVTLRRETPDDYLEILKPKKGPGRMEFNPYIPKTLSPKGYAKYKLMMSIASKQYETLVRRLQKENTLWEDPDFPATDRSIGNVQNVTGRVEWRRPKEINPNACLFVGGVSRFDVEQGALGDCWLLAVVSSVANHPALFQHLVPKEQKLSGNGYVGVFRCRFWRFGQWVEVLVDDRLPVYKGRRELAFMHSKDATEFWSALLEKAYAKLHGCYAHLNGGTQAEAMEDVTGGICESFELNDKERPPDLYKRMEIYAKRCCLMGCCVTSEIIEQKLNNGLIGGHAYSVTGVQTVTYNGRKQQLVRCRNPWGDAHEWIGPWSDRSSQWNGVSEQEKKQLAVEFSADGEFWMSFEDFVRNFTRLEVCHLGLESLEYNQEIRGKRRLEESIFSGQWQKNLNAGGCINNRATYHTNPQFRFTVEDPDPDDNELKTMVIIGLMQKDVRRKVGADFIPIGFMLYDAPKDQSALLSRAELMMKSPIGKSQFVNTREVTEEFRLKPGSYIVIPSTFEASVEASFILRILSQVKMQEEELDDDNRHEDLPVDVIEALKLEDMILNEDQEIEQKFIKLRDPNTKAINAITLGKLLNESTLQDIPNFKGFNKEMCRSMIAAIDSNLTGKVELSEFMDMWIRSKGWKHIFVKHDLDGTGYFNAYEFREALVDAGYRVSNRLFNALVQRYEDPGTEKISFEDFMLCVIRLRNAFETATAQPKNLEGTPLFNNEDYQFWLFG